MEIHKYMEIKYHTTEQLMGQKRNQRRNTLRQIRNGNTLPNWGCSKRSSNREFHTDEYLTPERRKFQISNLSLNFMKLKKKKKRTKEQILVEGRK